MTTKKRLHEVAKTLFNAKGYKNVSLREIALAADTTIGNLTYHFPRKEDLLLDIQHELYTDFLRMSVDGKDGLGLVDVLAESLRQIHANRTGNAFFYTNIVDFSHESPVIAARIQDFRRRVYEFYLKLFAELRNAGMARADLGEDQYRSLVYTLVAMTYMWMQNTTLYHDPAIPRIELDAAMRDLTMPYLTDQGRTAFLATLTNEEPDPGQHHT